MRFHALACDYDGTLASEGKVSGETVAALERLKASGRKLILVTGRLLNDLLTVFPQAGLCDRIVAENGALLYRPSSNEEVVLGTPPPTALVEHLQRREVTPLSCGRVIVATWEPHQVEALETIHELNLEMQVIFNKGAVMLLPSGINKATGLKSALAEMGLSMHNTVGVGDAENDHALLSASGCAVAVANAVASLKERADLVTAGDQGAGVRELIDRLVWTDLQELEVKLKRHHVTAGTVHGEDVLLSPVQSVVLIAGSSGGGKSTLAAGILKRLEQCGYQFCVIDPEGDYESVEYATTVGNAQRAPTPDEITKLLSHPNNNVVANLLDVPLQERPAALRALLASLQEMRAQTGRPHWLVLDEAHHVLPASGDTKSLPLSDGQSILMLTVDPASIARSLLSSVSTLIAIGSTPEESIRAFAREVGDAPPKLPEASLKQGECLVWMRKQSPGVIEVMETIQEPLDRRRHRRKYAEGELGEDRSFYFKGPKGELNLRASNLMLFLRIAEGIPDDVWLYHLSRGDYTKWFRDSIKDDDLAAAAAEQEHRDQSTAAESREAIGNAIHTFYTGPVQGSAADGTPLVKS